MAKAAQHTSGPWAAGLNPKGFYTNEVVIRPAGEFPHGLWIADCGNSVDPEPMANALLMAASPELLEALEDFVQWYLETPAIPRFSGVDRALHAIAKATGGSV